MRGCFAAVAQLVERNLAKVEVESSRLFCRSRFPGESQCFPPFIFKSFAARWQSGYAAACKAVYAGSIPARASRHDEFLLLCVARMVKFVDTRDLKSLGASRTGSIPGRASRHDDLPCVARMVKLVDTRDLKSLGASRTGSIPVPGTIRFVHDRSQPRLQFGAPVRGLVLIGGLVRQSSRAGAGHLSPLQWERYRASPDSASSWPTFFG